MGLNERAQCFFSIEPWILASVPCSFSGIMTSQTFSKDLPIIQTKKYKIPVCCQVVCKLHCICFFISFQYLTKQVMEMFITNIVECIFVNISVTSGDIDFRSVPGISTQHLSASLLA